MELYLLTTKGNGDFYLVAESPNIAVNVLTELLDKADYGYKSDRRIENIKILASEFKDAFNIPKENLIGVFPKETNHHIFKPLYNGI